MTVKEVVTLIVQWAGYLTGIASAIAIIIKPIRERLFNSSTTKEGIKCLLRSDILSIYYRARENNYIKAYELENCLKLYEAYTALGGNSFVVEIMNDIKEFKVE